jgi:L-asparaginase
MNSNTINRKAMRLCGSAALPIAALVAGTCVQAADAPSQQTSAATAMPRVLVLATGGTISGTADPRSAIGYNSGNV